MNIAQTYQVLLDAALDAMMVVDFESALFLEANPAACSLFGHSPAQFRELKGRDLCHPSEGGLVDAISEQLRGVGQASIPRVLCQRRDGSTFVGEMRMSVAWVDGLKLYMVIARDISWRIEQEQELARVRRGLARSRESYRALVEAVDDAVLVADFESGNFTDANPAACALFGISREAFQVMKGKELHPVEVHDRVDLMSAALRISGHAYMPHLLFQRAGGERFWGSVWLSRFQAAGAALFVAVIRDVSENVSRERALERSLRELKEAQAQLVRAGKLSAVGALGAGIAHELNQPLTAIQGFTQRVLRRPDDPVGAHLEDLEIVLRESRRAANIVDNIRTFAREGGFHPQPVEPMRPVEDALILMAQQLRSRGVEVRVESGADLPRVSADRAKLQQVFLNLLTNARDAMDTLPDGAPRRLLISSALQGDHVLYAVEDTGPGVCEPVRSRLFEPFVTDKPLGAGTGLGLSISRSIAREHRGDLTYTPAPGGGARFALRVPVHAEGGS